MVLLLRIPMPWMAVVAAAATLSTLSVVRVPGGGVQVGFHVTTITAILLGLIWLPALLRLIAIAGGGLKTPAGEASTPGLMDFLKLLDPGAERETLPALIAAADVAGSAPATAEWADLWRQQFEDRLASLVGDQPTAHIRLQDLARAYERIRREEPPGDERTFRMTELAAQARALRDSVSSDQIFQLFESGSDGERLVAIALIEAEPTSEFFVLLLDAISSSRSAFEQFHALRAMLDMLPTLSEPQRGALFEVLEAERSDIRGTDPQADPPRWYLMNELYRRLSPPRSVTRAEAIQFEQQVRRILERAGVVFEDRERSDLRRDIGVDHVVRVGGQKIVIEVKYAIGANRMRRIREAVYQVRGALEQLRADRGFVVVPEPVAVTSLEVGNSRIHVVTADELTDRLRNLH
jgi:hypothetical protein